MYNIDDLDLKAEHIDYYLKETFGTGSYADEDGISIPLTTTSDEIVTESKYLLDELLNALKLDNAPVDDLTYDDVIDVTNGSFFDDIGMDNIADIVDDMNDLGYSLALHFTATDNDNEKELALKDIKDTLEKVGK